MATISQKSKSVKAPVKAKLFSIRRQGNVSNDAEREILGTLRDYLNESIDQSLSENVRDVEDTKCVTLRLDYEETAETGEYGLLCFSKGLSKSLRSGRMSIGQMLDYPIQRQLIFQDLENKEPLIDNETGEQVVKYIIARPTGGSRIKVKIEEKKPNLEAETW
jgi:hypothetical protein